ncbi:hypothetical protein [Amycolatopsis sp. NPDC054798]
MIGTAVGAILSVSPVGPLAGGIIGGCVGGLASASIDRENLLKDCGKDAITGATGGGIGKYAKKLGSPYNS